MVSRVRNPREGFLYNFTIAPKLSGPASATAEVSAPSPAPSQALALLQIFQVATARSVAPETFNELAEGVRNTGDFAATLDSLHPETRAGIANALGHRVLRQFLLLSQETNPRLFSQGLFYLAQRLAGERNYEIAGASFAVLEALEPGTPLAAQAAEQLEVLRGGGSAGGRLEWWGREFFHQTADPSLWIGMGLAHGAFETLRFVSLRRLLPLAGESWTAALAARSAAWGIAATGETAAFTFGTHGIRALMGIPQDWSAEALRNSFYRNALGLVAMRSFGGAGREWVHAIQRNAPASSLLARAAIRLTPGVSSYLGLLLAHRLEVRAGLSEALSAEAVAINSLATLLQFSVIGHFVGRPLGEHYGRRLRMLETDLPSPRPPEGWRPERILDWAAQKLFPYRRIRPWVLAGQMSLLPGIQVAMMNGDGPVFGGSDTRITSGEGPPVERVVFPLRDAPARHQFKERFSDIELAFYKLYNFHRRRPNWIADAVESNQSFQRMVGELIRDMRQQTEGFEPPNELLQIQEETHNIHTLLIELSHRAHQEVGGPSGIPAHHVERFVASYYRCPNVLINYIDGLTDKTPPLVVSLRWIRTARETLAAMDLADQGE